MLIPITFEITAEKNNCIMTNELIKTALNRLVCSKIIVLYTVIISKIKNVNNTDGKCAKFWAKNIKTP